VRNSERGDGLDQGPAAARNDDQRQYEEEMTNASTKRR
jgi:hypothetical protein